jgi:CHAT domain-containing protein
MRYLFVVLVSFIYLQISAQAPVPFAVSTLQNEWNAIASGNYHHAWKLLGRHSNCPNAQVLKARLLHDQGASFLALQMLNAIDQNSASKCDGPFLLEEERRLLIADIYYQLNEFDLYHKEITSLGRFWGKELVNNPAKQAWYHTLQAKYFSAVIQVDSGRTHTCKALRLCWENPEIEFEFPKWQVYSNHVSCLRNGMGFPSDKFIAYRDTCNLLLNYWYPSQTIEKLRIQQALLMPEFDKACGVVSSNREDKEIIKKSVIDELARIENAYLKLTGKKHPYLANLYYLRGILFFYEDALNGSVYWLKKSIEMNYVDKNQHPAFCLNWRKLNGAYRIYNVSDTKRIFKDFSAPALFFYRKLLKRSEEIFYLRLLFNKMLIDQPENDAYAVMPFQELEFVSAGLYNKFHLQSDMDAAWDYSQKYRFNYHTQSKLQKSNLGYPQKFKELCYREMIKARMANDSLLLCQNQFQEFSKIDYEKTIESILTKYRNFRYAISLIDLKIPIISKYANDKFAFTIKKAQQKLKPTNAALLHVSHFAQLNEFYSLQWFITKDTAWVTMQNWKSRSYYLSELALNSITSKNTNKWKNESYQYYQQIIKPNIEILQKKGIHRLQYTSDPNSNILPPDVWITSFDQDSIPHFFIQDFAVSHLLTSLPDELQEKPVDAEVSPPNISINSPALPDSLVDLRIARKAAISIASDFNVKPQIQSLNINEVIQHLQTSDIYHLFSHGAAKQGIWLSNSFIKPEDIRKKDLNCELVAMVTCNSWKGNFFYNEGMAGMAEALTNAGVKRQIVSVWEIDELASAEIMQNFYGYLAKGKDADESLQLAKCDFLKNAAPNQLHPQYWGGLILFGESSGIPYWVNRNNNFELLILMIVLLGMFTLIIKVINKKLF